MNWNLDSYFPEFNGTDMLSFKKALVDDIAITCQKAQAAESLNASTAETWEKIFLAYEDISRRCNHLSSYIGCLTAADANNEDYQKEDAANSKLGSESSKIVIELMRTLRDADQQTLNNFLNREKLASAAYYLNRMHQKTETMMDPPLERLNADLSVDGISAWSRLYDTLTGKLEFEMTYPDGSVKTHPMSMRRSLMMNTNRAIRKAAFEGGNKAWQSIENSAAAALNAIAGTRLTLNKNRKVDHFLDNAVFESAISHECLDALFDAIHSEIAFSRKLVTLRARLQKTEGVAWYDLGAPLPLKNAEDNLTWDEALKMVEKSFSLAYPKLGAFFKETIEKQWIEWEPRNGKRPGAFCTGSLLTREPRIYMTFQNTLGDVRTLAHEVGHAFHYRMLEDLRPFSRGTPMTLAESASTFGEMLLSDGILNDPATTDLQKINIYDMEIAHGAIYLLDIPVRYEFEKRLHEARSQGELSVSELKTLMVEAQKNIFGDTLEDGGEDPYFWASKLHFYIIGRTFYNYPYTFGFLFSRVSI